MSMHLHHPSLSMTGKKKGKMKFTSAQQKRDYEQLAVNWKAIKQSHGAELEDNRRKRAMAAAPLQYNLNVPTDRSTKHIPSLNTGGAVAALKPVPVYTGTKMIGIGQLHKSNAVPVFSSDDAKDIARMRRG